MLRIISYHNHFGPLSQKTVANLDEVVRDTAQRVRNRAKYSAPVDTSALRESLYVADDQGSDYQERADEAANLRNYSTRPGSPARIMQEERPPAPHSAIVASAVEHGAYVEFGTVEMPPRPFMRRAVRGEARRFRDDVDRALRGEYIKDWFVMSTAGGSSASVGSSSAGEIEAGGAGAIEAGGAAALVVL